MPPGCGAIWRQCVERHPLAGAAPVGRRRASQAARWRSAVATHRGSWRSHSGSSCRDARHHPPGAERAAGTVGRTVERRRALALLQAPQTDAQKKTAHASEQDRPDVLKRREDWFESQLDLDPKRLVFIDGTWTSTNMARTHGRLRRLRAGVARRRQRPSSPGFGAAGSRRPLCSMVRSTETLLRSMSKRFFSAEAGRHRRDGQSVQPHGGRRPCDDRGGRREPALPAAKQPRLQTSARHSTKLRLESF